MTWQERFHKEFVAYHPGDSGFNGNDPQEAVYEVTESDPKEYIAFISQVEKEAEERVLRDLLQIDEMIDEDDGVVQHRAIKNYALANGIHLSDNNKQA